MKKVVEIIKSSCPLYKKPNDFSELISEGLFGEHLEIIKYKDRNWIFVKLLTDDYNGWTKINFIGKCQKKNYRVIVPRSTLYTEPNLKSTIINFLPLGSQLKVIKIIDNWATIQFYEGKTKKLLYIPSQHIIKIGEKVFDWVHIAEQLIGTPYRWGGRNTIGIDCSALVQLCLQTIDKKVPRDTIMQQKLNYPDIKSISDIKRGMLIFWKGHVAISINKRYIVHSNAFHMNTIKEPLIGVNKRISKDYGNITKILNLSESNLIKN